MTRERGPGQEGEGEGERDSEAHPGRISTRRVYSGRVIALDVDTVRFPNGTTGELEMIRHPGASAVVPFLGHTGAAGEKITGDSRLLLIKQYRYAAEGFVYEVPAGRLDSGETPESCALRELQEETGYSAGQLHRLTTIYTTPGFTDERIHLFIAGDLRPGAMQHERDEILSVETVSLSHAVAMIREGKIIDGKSCVAILLAAELHRAETLAPE